MSDDLAFAPALEIAARVRAREISVVELTQLFLDRIDALNPRLDAYLTVAAAHALDAAAGVDRAVAAMREHLAH